MMQLVIGQNMNKQRVPYNKNRTLREAFEEFGIDYSMGMNTIDGCTLKPGDLDKTFEEFGVGDRCFLLNVVKMDNAILLAK